MNKREFLKQLELVRLATEQLPEGAELDGCWVKCGRTPNIILKRGITEAAAAFGAEGARAIGSGESRVLFFNFGPLRVVQDAPER